MRKRGVLIVPDRVNRAVHKLACQAWRMEYLGTDKDLYWTYDDPETGKPLLQVALHFKKRRKKIDENLRSVPRR